VKISSMMEDAKPEIYNESYYVVAFGDSLSACLASAAFYVSRERRGGAQ